MVIRVAPLAHCLAHGVPVLSGGGSAVASPRRRVRARCESCTYLSCMCVPAIELVGMVHGAWCIVQIPLLIVYGLQFDHLWFMVYGLRFMVCGLWFVVYGLWLVVWSMVCGL